jgi:hypothetical protein
VGLVSKSADWEEHFLERYPEPSEERTKRIKEARASLEWIIDQPKGEITWLVNDYQNAETRGQEFINRITSGEPGPDRRKFAIAMLRRAYLLK